MDRPKYEEKEIPQSDVEQTTSLKAEGFVYHGTYHHDATKIDIYRKAIPELPCNDWCLCTKCLIRMDKAGYANYVLPE